MYFFLNSTQKCLPYVDAHTLNIKGMMLWKNRKILSHGYHNSFTGLWNRLIVTKSRWTLILKTTRYVFSPSVNSTNLTLLYSGRFLVFCCAVFFNNIHILLEGWLDSICCFFVNWENKVLFKEARGIQTWTYAYTYAINEQSIYFL